MTEVVAVREGLPEKVMSKLTLEKAHGNVWAGEIGAVLLCNQPSGRWLSCPELPGVRGGPNSHLGVGVRTR